MKEYEKWFKKAENDLLAIKHLIGFEHAPYDVCCFHAQQAAEKYLKSYLVSKNVEFPRTHDLKKLVELCLQFNEKFNEVFKLVTTLTEFGVTPRYPDDFDDLILEDAQQAYQNSLLIKDFVITHFFE